MREIVEELTDLAESTRLPRNHPIRRAAREIVTLRGLAADRKPVAWLHTMHMELDQTAVRVSLSPHHSFGRHGQDFDVSYRVTSEPLFALPEPPKEGG